MTRTIPLAVVLLAACVAAASAQTPPPASTAAPAPPAQAPAQAATQVTGPPASAIPVTASSLEGMWEGSFDFNGELVPQILDLTVSGGAITGTIQGGKIPLTPIHDATLHDDTLSFWIDTVYEGNAYRLVYTGKVTPLQIAFTFGTDDGSWSSTLTLTRPAQSVPVTPAIGLTGTWRGAFDFNGRSVPLTFHFTAAAGGAVTGTVEGLPTTPAAIHDGKLEDGILTFWLNTDYEGQTYKLVYKGKLAASQILFDMGTEDGSWGASITATRSL